MPGHHLELYTPRPKQIEPVVYFHGKSRSLYRVLVFLGRRREFPQLDLLNASTPRHVDGTKIMGAQRTPLIRCTARHMDYGRCLNPFCVHSPVPFSALQEPTIPVPTAEEVRSEILAYTDRH